MVRLVWLDKIYTVSIRQGNLTDFVRIISTADPLNLIDAHSADRPHVGTDPVSVRPPSVKDGINTKPQSKRENIVMRSADRIGMGIGQTRGLSLHAAYRPSGNVRPIARQGQDNFS